MKCQQRDHLCNGFKLAVRNPEPIGQRMRLLESPELRGTRKRQSKLALGLDCRSPAERGVHQVHEGGRIVRIHCELTLHPARN